MKWLFIYGLFPVFETTLMPFFSFAVLLLDFDPPEGEAEFATLIFGCAPIKLFTLTTLTYELMWLLFFWTVCSLYLSTEVF
jgi:hypothetical protein